MSGSSFESRRARHKPETRPRPCPFRGPAEDAVLAMSAIPGSLAEPRTRSATACSSRGTVSAGRVVRRPMSSPPDRSALVSSLPESLIRGIGGPGFWALVPGGVTHTFGNAGASPARLLIIHAPAAEAYFVELQALWSKAKPPTPEEERALMRRHGLEPVEARP